MTKTSSVIILCTFLFTGCGQPAENASVAVGDPGSSFEDIYTAAETAIAEAEAKRNLWSKTEGMLRDSRTAYDAGRIDEAIELATEAKLQAELASAQVDTELEAWQSRVLSN